MGEIIHLHVTFFCHIIRSMTRCPWPTTPLMIEYHDKEWGVPVHDDRTIFEFLVLESAQAGLSWEIVLRKRETYRKAFHNFDPHRIARYTARDLQRLLNDSGIIRNRAKIAATIENARYFLKVQEEFGSFDAYIWRFVNGNPIKHKFRKSSQIPEHTDESEALARDLKQRGFKFLGPTICYSHMQAAGMVNDHLVSCFRYKEV
ncbi:MAG TPA: DNA-3-methyladenine glycosylase I [Candidatus Deferrimicrobium sp.]|nr:DNA-3-methyladenine glycosylase I [Candidatus Deferrimicrobium sp.]